MTQVYVICDRGQPVVVCADRPTTQLEVNDRDRRWTRVYHVPLVASGAIVATPEE